MSATKAGEFFIALGVKGDEQTTAKVDKAKDSFKELKATSTEAKLAILAALYGIERLVSTYGVMGTQLKNFNTISGISTKTLQEYEIAAQKAGASNQELTQTFDSLQKMMYGVQTGQTSPAWLQVITGTLQGQGVQFSDAERQNTAQEWLTHPELMFQRLSTFAQNKLLKPSQTTNVLRELGLSDNIIAGMMRGMFNGEALRESAGEVLSQRTIDQLTDLNKEWTDMTFKFKQFMGTIAGGDLPGIVKNLSGMASQLERIGRDLDLIGHKGGIFKALSGFMKADEKALGGLADILEGKKGGIGKLFEGIGTMSKGPMGFVPYPKSIVNFRTNVEIHVKETTSKVTHAIGQEFKTIMHNIADSYSAKAGS